MMLRSEYMSRYSAENTREAQTAVYRKYQSQFVNEATIRQVVNRIGANRLLASTDPHLNDIPLHEWDKFSGCLTMACSFKSAGDYATLAGYVCIAKEAARQFIESQGE